MKSIGVDLGGTSCSVVKANRAGRPEAVDMVATGTAEATLAQLEGFIAAHKPDEKTLIGVACGDPLDWRKGIIQGPPNMPGWTNIPIVERFQEKFGAQTYLMNDANAGALAEWRFGAGKGCRNLIFLTAGTGMGAGLILDGRLYEGTTGSAGEVGHIRLAPDGPAGYGKDGSFEGFCSGGGIAQLARAWAYERDGQVTFNPGSIEAITAKHVGEAAAAGDDVALEILRVAGHKLGEALALLVDLLNPERIVLGSIYTRCRPYLEPAMREVLEREALPRPLGVCEIVPTSLGEAIGPHAALCVAPYRAGLWTD
jgi:glucokinase